MRHRIHIIEPHGDDALLSAWPLLFSERAVLTTFSARPSYGLETWFTTLQADFLDWGNISSAMRPLVAIKRIEDLELSKWHWQAERMQQVVRGWWEKYYHAAFWFHGCIRAMSSREVLAVPIGIIHPFHILIGSAASLAYCHKTERPDARRPVPMIFYSDAPYNGCCQEIEKFHPVANLPDYKLLEIKASDWPNRRFSRKDIFKNVYPTERKLVEDPVNVPYTLENTVRLYVPDGMEDEIKSWIR